MTPAELHLLVSITGSQERLARVLNVSTRTVQYWLAGKHTPSPMAEEKIRKLSNKLDREQRG